MIGSSLCGYPTFWNSAKAAQKWRRKNPCKGWAGNAWKVDRVIHEMLLIGERNAKAARDLARSLGVTPRYVSKTVFDERRQGIPICASVDNKNPGYYLPANRAEFERYCRQLSHRVKETTDTLLACSETLSKMKDG